MEERLLPVKAGRHGPPTRRKRRGPCYAQGRWREEQGSVSVGRSVLRVPLLANAAKLMEKNPPLYQLRVLHAATEAKGSIVVHLTPRGAGTEMREPED